MTTLAGSLREVTSLEVQVLLDNVTDIVSSVPDDVVHETELLRRDGTNELRGERLCHACFGLSLVVTAHLDGTTHRLLFDAGPEAAALERNALLMRTRLGSVECVVLSHGHWDHAGGLLRALELIRLQRGSGVPCYVHPDMFRGRGIRLPDGDVLPFASIPAPEEMDAIGASVVSVRTEQFLGDGTFYLSGEIPRVSAHEKGLPDHVRRSEDGTRWEPDPWIMDERFLAVNVENRGLLVLTACSHAGIINVLSHARSRFPSIPPYGIMGGFHLAGASMEPNIHVTVKQLAMFGLRRIVPAHCTGWRAVTSLVNAFGDSVVVPSAVGRVIRFGKPALPRRND